MADRIREWVRINRINRARISTIAGYMALFNGGLESGDEVYITSGSTPPAEDTDAVVSDDFAAASLSDMWTFDGGVGSAVLDTAGAEKYLEITVPSGDYGAWNTNTAPHLVQECGDIDLDITVKFLTEPTGDNQDQGILVELDNNDFIRFDVYHDGADLKIFVGEVVSGSSQARANLTITTGQATYINLQRTGDDWLYRRSSDGENWTTVLSRTNFVMTVANVGVFAASSTNGYTAQFDYFFDTDSPVSPEDGGTASRELITIGQEVDFGTATASATVDRLAVMDAATGGNVLDSILFPSPMQIGVGDRVSVHRGNISLNQISG